MKTLFSFRRVVSGTLLLLLCACDQTADWQVEIVDTATEKTETLSAHKTTGKRLFINYWASWCKPCLTEIPELNAFAREHEKQVILLGFNFDQKQGAELLSAMRDVNMTFPALLTNPASVFAIPEIEGLPTTLVLDDQGRLITVLMGPQTITSLQQALLTP